MTDEEYEKVAEAYHEYSIAKESAKTLAREAYQRALDDALVEARAKLSKVMHEAHANGLTKDRIRRAVRAHGNSAVFDPLWSAYQPEVETDLRRKRGNDEDTSENRAERWEWSGDDLVVWLGDTEYVLENVSVDASGDVEWANFPVHIGDDYPILLRLASEAVAGRDE